MAEFLIYESTWLNGNTLALIYTSPTYPREFWRMELYKSDGEGPYYYTTEPSPTNNDVPQYFLDLIAQFQSEDAEIQQNVIDNAERWETMDVNWRVVQSDGMPATLKSILFENDPPAVLAMLPSEGEAGYPTYWFENHDNTLVLRDYDESGKTSGFVSITATARWKVKLRIEVDDQNYFTGSGWGSFDSDQVSEKQRGEYWGKANSQLEVVLETGNQLDIDIDQENDRISRFKLVLNDRIHEKRININDHVRVTLVDLIYTGQGGQSIDPEDDPTLTFEVLVDRIDSADPTDVTPFETVAEYGQTSWSADGNTLEAENTDVPTWAGGYISGGFMVVVKQGYWAKFRLMNEKAAYFNAIAASASLDPMFSNTDFEGGNSNFDVVMYGGGILIHDMDAETSKAFYLQTGTGQTVYEISDPASNDAELKLLDWGEGEPPIEPPTTVDPTTEDDYWAQYRAESLDWALWGTIGILTFLALFVWAMRRRNSDG